jgi:hypothetical protein
MLQVWGTLAMIAEEPMSLLDKVTPTPDDLPHAQMAPLPLALRPRLPWLVMSIFMMNGIFFVSAIVGFVSQPLDGRDAGRFYYLLPLNDSDSFFIEGVSELREER